jgi:hypothetical protein
VQVTAQAAALLRHPSDERLPPASRSAVSRRAYATAAS